jgi:hypothetical protein
MKKNIGLALAFFGYTCLEAQVKWVKVDSLFGELPVSVHIYKTTDPLDGKPNIAYYVEADLKDKSLSFTTDTTDKRRITPSQFYEKNNTPLLVVNTTFFSYASNRSLNVVIKDGQLVSCNPELVRGRGADSVNWLRPFNSAIGISAKRKADVAWLYTDSLKNTIHASQKAMTLRYPPIVCCDLPRRKVTKYLRQEDKWYRKNFSSWKMQSAVGGGPVVLQNGDIQISNNEENKFAGKALNDKHPRTAMGYTKDNKLIILVIEGRHTGTAEGATLTEEAQLFKDIGCEEALNLDGGGSSCLLVNGKETIKPSDKEGQRPVPAVFIVKVP